MNRRFLLAGMAMLGGCSVLPSVPYEQRREWPLAARRSAVVPPRAGGRVLLVRTTAAAPGLEARGLRWQLPDGSLHVDFYEQWAVPPAQAVDSALRQFLADSGLFAAVVGPGSRVPADLVLEPELTTLIADPGAHIARAALALVLLDQRPGATRVLLQTTVTAQAPLAGEAAPELVAAMQAAVSQVLRAAERAIGAAVPP